MPAQPYVITPGANQYTVANLDSHGDRGMVSPDSYKHAVSHSGDHAHP